MFSNTSTIVDIAILIVAVLVSMTTHEAMHAYISYKLGDTTAEEEGRLSLNPLRHIDPIMTIVLPLISLFQFHTLILAAKPVPFNPHRVRYNEFGGALIAIAGPLTNLAIALIAAAILSISPHVQLLSDVLRIFISLNVSLFIFNLVPIPPLDGSRVLYAFAPESVQHFMRSIEPYGFFLIIGLVTFGGFGGILVTLNNYILQFLIH